MKKVLAIALVGIMAIGLVGCATRLVPGAEWTEDGTILFMAEGVSVASDGTPLAAAKARVASAVNAKANLLEKIKGAIVQGDVTVADLMFKSQNASTEVSGWLARASIDYEVPEGKRSEKPKATLIKAIASLELEPEDFENLEQYLE